jgi:hypothetical protein
MSLARSPWREPMVWLVFGLPLFAVAASFLLLSQALRGGPDDAVIDTVHHTAQMQVADFGPEENAAALGLSATLLATPTAVTVVPVTGRFDPGVTLRLTLAHPADDDQDRREPLSPAVQGWEGAAIPLDANDWIVRLESADGRWRLRGRLPRGQRAVLLTPALHAPANVAP